VLMGVNDTGPSDFGDGGVPGPSIQC
jgi:hypothetical protein